MALIKNSNGNGGSITFGYLGKLVLGAITAGNIYLIAGQIRQEHRMTAIEENQRYLLDSSKFANEQRADIIKAVTQIDNIQNTMGENKSRIKDLEKWRLEIEGRLHSNSKEQTLNRR